MKANPRTNYEWLRDKSFTKEGSFYRKGQLGDWKSYFNEDESKMFDEVIETNLKHKINFNYEMITNEE